MKRITGKERLLKMAYGGLSPEKAKQMLKDDEANGKPLTAKQKGYFGAVAGGNARKKFPTGGKAGDPNKPKAPIDRPTTQDSLNLYNNALQVLDYYNKRGYSKQNRQVSPNAIEELEKDAANYREDVPRTVPTKGGNGKRSADLKLPKSQYRKDLNANQFLQREGANFIVDTRAPMAMYDKRIKPTKHIGYKNEDVNDPLYGDAVDIYSYDPNTIMPAFMKPKSKSSSSKLNISQPKPALKPAPELNPTKVQNIVQNQKPNVQATIKPQTVSNKSKYSATYRDPNQPDKQKEIYFPTKKAWSDFMGTGALGSIDTSEKADESEAHATGYKTGVYAGGGEVGDIGNMEGVTVAAGGSGGGGGYGMAAQLLPQIGNAIQSLLDKPSYTNQPIMNAQTARNMTRPAGYAFGGELDDVDEDQYQNWLKGMFQNQETAEGDQDVDNDGLEEFGEGTNDSEDTDVDTEETYAYGGKKSKSGIYIKPSKRGTFTAAANKHGKSVQSFAAQVMANKENYSPAMVKKANFARNAAKWKHAMGGGAAQVDQPTLYAQGGWIKKAINPEHKGYCTPMTKSTCTPRRKALARTFKKHHGFHAMGGDAQIEVEGNEILEAPNGEMMKAQGPTHEEGGIAMNVPDGTKIYSDRLGIEGKTMQQRKTRRERVLGRLEKALDRNPADQFLKNSYTRTKDTLDNEDAQDMELMKFANKLYAPPERDWRQGGGKQDPNVTAAYGDEIDSAGDPWGDYINSLVGGTNTQVPFIPGADTSQVPNYGSSLSGSTTGRGINVNAPVNARTAESIGLQTPSTASRYSVPSIPQEQASGNASGFTTGDYVGMGANLFNAIAPIINTRNAARATRPEMNRFKGFGREALEANQKAQTFAGQQAAYAKRNLDTAFNSTVARNRAGARGINTMRALDTVADINRNKAIGDIDLGYANQMTGLLGQQGQLANIRDQAVMTGEQARDERQAQNIDNYYTNMAENLTNFGTNIGNIGRSLNQAQANKDNQAMLEQMSEYFDFARDKNGRLVLRNKRKS